MRWGEPSLSELLLAGYLALLTLLWLGLAQGVSVWRRRFSLPARPVPGSSGPSPRVSVIVPARNEVDNIGACVRAALASHYADLEVIVVDDGSTDGTAAAAASAANGDPRLRVLAGSALPDGWAGKPWACQQAATTVTGERLLFVDADVELRPEAVGRVVELMDARGLDLVSAFGSWRLETFWERAAIPVIGWFIRGATDIAAVNDPGRSEAFANGQFILVRRDAYVQAGGHEAVKADILDDVGLARAFVAKDLPIRVVFMRELFSCRMYTNFRELWLGWTKNLYAGMRYSVALPMALSGFVLFEFVLPYFLPPLALLRGDRVGLVAALAVLGLIHTVRFWMDGIFGQDRRYGLLQGLGATMLVGLLLDSVRRSRLGQVAWKGRMYTVGRADETAES